MRITTATSSSAKRMIASLLIVFLWMTAAEKTSAEDNDISALGMEEGFEINSRPAIGEESPLLILEQQQHQQLEHQQEHQQEHLLPTTEQQHNAKLELPPIPPIHPVHTGSVQYSSVMEADGTVTYRRDIHAPCNYGMLVFNVGPSKDDLPYHYDLYGDAYLFSDNGGLCILYPTYTGYQVSPYGPFWKPGYDPATVKFRDLVTGVRHMHRISSRILSPPSGGATQHSEEISKLMAGDYIIMGKHNFYSINYYKQLKEYINSWGPNGPSASDDTNEIEVEVEVESWLVTDASTMTTATTTTAATSLSEMQ